MSEVEVKISQLQEVARGMTDTAERIRQSVTRAHGIVDELLGLGFQSPAADEFMARYRRQRSVMDTWPEHLSIFSTKLIDASEALYQANRAMGQVLGASASAWTRSEDFPYVSKRNRGLYDKLVNKENEIDAAIAERERMIDSRDEKQRQLEELEAKLADLETVEGGDIGEFLGDGWEWLASRLDGTYGSTAEMIDSLKAEIADLDVAIDGQSQTIATLEQEAAGFSGRLEKVMPGPGANLDEIRRIEEQGTAYSQQWRPDTLREGTPTCTTHVIDKVGMPRELIAPAGEWNDRAEKYPQYGVTIHKKPLPGSVLVMEASHDYAGGGPGHVAYVERVDANGEVWITDNKYPNEPVKLSSLTTDNEGISYLYLPWHTKV